MKRRHSNQSTSRFLFEELEPRLLLSADLGGGVIGTAVEHEADHPAASAPAAGEVSAPAAPRAGEHQSHELVIIDAATPNYQLLLDDLIADRGDGRRFEVAFLDADRNGVEQLTGILAGYSGLDAVHLISHGTGGSVALGNSALNLDGAFGNARVIQAWGDAFSDDGDFLIYGCELASTAEGEALVDTLSKLTRADVAASDDLTGAAVLGGDWDLEYRAGSVEANVAFSAAAQESWAHVLAVGVDNTSTGTSGGGDFSISHTTSGANRLMLVSVSINQNLGAETVDSITYNGDTLTLVGAEETGDARVEIWALVAPKLGPGNVDIVMNGTSDGNTAGVMTFTGVDQGDPLGDFAFNSGTANNGTATVVSAANELVFAAISVDENVDYDLVPGATQTERWDLKAPQVNGGGSTDAGAASVNMSWSWGGTDAWAIGGVSIKPLQGSLWLSMANDVTAGGAPGDDTWTGSEVMQFNDPNLVFDPVAGITNGTFDPATFSLEVFANPANANVLTEALHFVNSNITVGGANAISLQAGDLLLVTDNTYTFTSTNSLTVNKTDVFMFRPDTVGDYSSGTFTMLLDNPVGELAGISLIEQDTVLPDMTLNAGDFLLIAKGQQNNILLFETTDVGAGTTSGTDQVLLNGSDTNVAFGKSLTAIDLVETTMDIGGVTLASGTLLASVDSNTTVGGNGLNVQRVDIFTLTVNATNIGSGAGDVTATLLLDGSDIDLNVDAERPFGISTRVPDPPVVTIDLLTTHDSNPRLTGTVSDPNASISVTVGANVYAATNNGDGTWALPNNTISPLLPVGTYDISVTATDTSGNSGSDSTTDELVIEAPLVDRGELWVSIEDDTPGASGWDGLSGEVVDGGDIVSFGGAPNTYGDSTTGTFSRIASIQNLVIAGSDRINAVHHVSRDLVAGTNSIQLQTGDILISVFDSGGTTFQNSDLSTTVADHNDVVLFRPDKRGDYSEGTFSILIDGDDIGLNSVMGISLVELSTTVGGITLNDGDFLIVDWQGDTDPASNHIQRFQPGTLGDTTSGSLSVFVDVNDLLSLPPALSPTLTGIEIMEIDSEVGDTTLNKGTILASLSGSDTVGGIAVTEHDVFAMTITTAGVNTVGSATMFFDGSDVGLDVAQEDVRGLALGANSRLVVDTDSDIADGDTSSIADLIANKGADGFISLREAIIAANNTTNGVGPDLIHFAIGGGGLKTIFVGPGGLPSIDDAVILDATTQGGYAGDPIIELDGSGATGATAGIWILSDGSTVKGFIVHSFPDEGIEIDLQANPSADSNIIQNNWVGVDATGAPAGNADHGILITDGATGNLIGGSGPNEGNVIAGNAGSGIVIRINSADNVVEGNIIGLRPDGTTPAGNANHGIAILSGATNNRIGGIAPGAGNIIGHNGQDGIHVDGAATTGNSLLGNLIFSNTGLGINLNGGTEDGFGVTGNDGGVPPDTDTGANNLQNYPVLTSVLTNGSGSTNITGTINTTPGTSFRLEFFSSVAGDGSGHGEAEQYLGFINITTDVNGDASFDATLSATVGDGDLVTAVATEDLGGGNFGDSSEFAANFAAVLDVTAPVVAVDPRNTNDRRPQLTGTVDDPTAAISVTVNGNVYAATNNGDGTWTLADDTITPALLDGTYDVSVTATDKVGNAGSDASTDELVVDATAPVVTVDSLNTNDTTPQLTGTVDDPTATISVTVDGNVYAATNNGDGTWTLADDAITPALADGTYDVAVTATDTFTNAGSDASTDELVVDATAPVVTVDSLNTNDTTPQLTGTVDDPTATISVTVDGNVYAATNNGDGTWTLADDAITPALADGTYDVSVTATDTFTNAGSDASTDELIVDATAPTVTVDSLNTNDTTPQLTGTVDDPTATISVTVDGNVYAATNNGDGTWTLADDSITPALADGTYDVSVTATDTFTNAGSDASTDELIVDATAPTVTVDSLNTNDTTPQLTGTVDDPTATISVTVDGNVYAATNNGDGTWTLADDAITPALADGTYDVSVTATDTFTNAGSDASTDELVVDATAPVVTVDSLNTNDTTPQLTGTVDDPTATISVTVDGNVYAATNNGDGTWTLADDAITPALADGTYDVAVTATDTFSNAGSDASTDELVVDATAPVVTVDPLNTNDTTPQLTGTVDDPTATISVTVDGNVYAATNNGDGTWTLADDAITPALADGTYDVSVTATDTFTNAGSDASTDELIVDATAPTVTVDSLNTNDTTPQLTGTVDDPTATISVTVDGNVYAATNNGDGTWTLADDAITPALADGTYDVSVTATDTFTNAGSDASTDELIVDATAPTVTVDSLNTNDTTPQLTGTVDDPTATISVTVDGNVYAATNNGDGTWTLADDSITPALADGTYDVSVTATDTFTNAGSDASTDELIVDATAPTVTVDSLNTNDTTPQLTGTVDDPTATISVTVDGNVYAATNNGDGTWTLADDAITPALADGTYDVAVTATDTFTNAGSDASTDELVVDATAPVVTVDSLNTNDTTPQLTGTVDDPTATISVTVDGNVYAATNNGDGTWTLADDAITPALADGTYDVAVTATDTFSNAGSDASTDELVVDATAPVVTVDPLNTNDTTPQLTGTVDDPTATISVTVDGNVYAATNNGDGTWTLADDAITPALADGTYDVSVTATDTFTNAGSDASTDELVVDATAPTVTVDSLNTNDTTPQLTGTVDDPTATISVTVDGNVYAATNNGDGTWTLADDAITPALADGTYDVAVTATDTFTNAGSDASTDELVVDATAPVVTVDSLNTNDTTPQLTGTVDDPTATISVTVDGNVYAATNNGDGTWTLADDAITPALADGTYDVSVTATDTFTNAGSDASTDELIVDATAPTVTVDSLNTNDTTPQLTGTVDDPTATISVTVDGNVYAATNNGDGTWTLADDAITPALADGTYDVSVTATDTFTNAGSDASTDELVVDATAPVVTVDPLNTNDTTPQLTGTVDDPTATISVTVNGNVYAATNNGDGTWTLADDAITPALADGTYDVAVTATDTFTNAGSDASTDELVVDATAPIVTVNPLATNDTTPRLTGLVNDAGATIQVTVDGNVYAATNNGDGTWTLADNSISPALADGIYDVSVTATDTFTNAGSDASTNELVVDATAPVVTVDSLNTNDTTPQLTGTVDDPTATISVTVNGNGYAATNNGDGTWTLADDSITPALADGTYDVAVTATDTIGNAGSDASTNELTIDTNQAPVAADDSYTINEDTGFNATLNVNDLLLNDSDPNGDPLTVNTTPVSGPSNGTLLLNNDGTFTYTPDADFNGTDTFIYEISDGNGGTAQATVTITVNPVNDAPVAAGEAYTLAEDGSLVTVLGIDDLLGNDSDVDGDSLMVTDTPVSGPAHGVLLLNPDGTFTYSPDADFHGTDTFTYEISDGNGGTTQATVAITITPVNDAPVGGPDGIVTEGSGSRAIDAASLLANDIDVDGDVLTIVGYTQPEFGSLSEDGSGGYLYTPPIDFVGIDTFSYTVSDPSGSQDTVLVAIAVDSLPAADDTLDPPPASDEPRGTKENDDETDDEDQASGDKPAAKHSEPVSAATDSLAGDISPLLAGLPDLDGSRFVDTRGDSDRASPNIIAKTLYDALQMRGVELDFEALGLGGVEFNFLWQALDIVKDQMSSNDGGKGLSNAAVVQIATGTSLAFSAGFVSWVLRGGALASTLLTTMPMWKGFDPLPIIQSRRQAEDSSVEQPLDEAEDQADILFAATNEFNAWHQSEQQP